MSISFVVGQSHYSIGTHPETCPRCNAIIQAHPVHARYRKHDANTLFVVYECLNTRCAALFLGAFMGPKGGVYGLVRVEPITPTKREFAEIIQAISPSFCSIYNEAYYAEQNQLTQICGMGYRKALEFLMKDYIISLVLTEQEEAVKSKMLGRCIEEYIENKNIKNVAKRAVWLGNDETHYVRKWEDKDVTDLKKLIDITLVWIENEELTKQALLSMPE